MPDLSGNRASLRLDGHAVRAYLAVFNGTAVASGTLNSTPSNGAVALAWTRTAGSSSDIKPGYRVTVEDGSGNIKLETSVRYSGTISDSSIPIREIATAEFTLSASDVVKIYNTPVLTDKLVEDEATFAPDGITYSAQNTTISPITNSGGHWCGFVDAGQTYATVATYGAASFTVDPDSAGTTAHLWTLPTGVAFAGGSANTDASPTLQADVGYYVVTHTVTDSSNSATWTQYLLLRVYDATITPVECVIESIDADETQGWSGRVRVFSSVSISSIPDRSLVAVFVQETIGGSTASYGNRISGRSHIKLLGYLVRDENEGDGQDDRLTFEIISPWARLQEIPGFSKVLERYSSTTGWSYIQALTVKRAMLQILRWYTNWTEYFDTIFQTFTDYDYPAFYVEKNTPLAQLQELADGTDARVTGDRTGAMLIGTRQELVALASRSSLTTTITLQDDDRITYRFSRDHFKTVDTLECRGFVSATSTASAAAIFSRYPGIPGRGAAVTAIDRLIAASQSDLNSRCGLRGAAADGVFITSAGVTHRAVELELELPGAYDVFDPAYQEWVAFTGAAGNRRGLDLSAFRFVLRSVNVTYANGTAQSNLRLVSETAAPAGQTYVPKATPGPQPDFSIEFPMPEFPDVGDFRPGAGSGRIALPCQNGLARTTNFGNGDVTVWDYQSWSAMSGVAGSAVVFTPDAFSYTGGNVGGWICIGNNRVYRLDITARSLTLRATFAVGGGLNIDSSILSENFVVVARTEGFQGNTRVAYTTDDSTWSQSDLTSSGPLSQRSEAAVFISQRTAGKAWAQSRHTGWDHWSRAYVTTNYGASWALETGINFDINANYDQIYSPFVSQNTGETIWFAGGGPHSNQFNRINGLSITNIRPSYSGYNWVPCSPRNSFSTAPGNANRLLLAGTRWSGVTLGGYQLFITNNALGTPTWTPISNGTGLSFTQCAIAGDNPNAFYLWGGTNGSDAAVAYSPDGVSVYSQVGNLASFSPGKVVGLAGW